MVHTYLSKVGCFSTLCYYLGELVGLILVTLGSDGVVTISLLVTQMSDHYSATYRLNKTGIYTIHVLLFI